VLNIFDAPLLAFVGVEEEYLKRHAASLAAYKKGVQVKKSMSGTELKSDVMRNVHIET
jgi:hypothetical protein